MKWCYFPNFFERFYVLITLHNTPKFGRDKFRRRGTLLIRRDGSRVTTTATDTLNTKGRTFIRIKRKSNRRVSIPWSGILNGVGYLTPGFPLSGGGSPSVFSVTSHTKRKERKEKRYSNGSGSLTDEVIRPKSSPLSYPLSYLV